MFVPAALLIRLGLAWVATSLAPVSTGAACQVEVRPGDASRAWIAAAAAVRDSLRDRGAADRDCRMVVISAGGPRPSVEVVTVDGRRGVRRLADAGDVAATVAALIVTVQEEAASYRDEGDAALPAVTRADAPAADRAVAGWRPQILLAGGARWSLPGPQLPGMQSALLELGLGVARPGWELGVFGAWAPTTFAIGSSVSPSFTSSAEAAIGGAWRLALGASNVDLILGGRAGVVSYFLGGENPDMVGADVEGVAPTVTAFAGAAFATRSRVHLRPQLWYQWSAATRLGGTQDGVRLASVGLSLGVESRVP